MGRFQKLRRGVLRLSLMVLAAITLFLVLIHLPPVQSYLTNRLNGYLQNKLQTEVRIDAIRLRLPKSVAFKGVYLEDQRQDTLLHVSELALGFRLGKLLHKEIQLSSLHLEGGTLYLHTNVDSLSNYAFVGEAFASLADTLPAVQPENASSWQFTANQANLVLRDIYVDYKDFPTQTTLACDLQRLEAAIPILDLQKKRYHIGGIEAEGITLDLAFDSIDTSTVTPDKSPRADYDLEVASMQLKKLSFNYRMGKQQYRARLEELGSSQLDLQLLADKLELSLPALTLHGGRLQYEDGNTPQITGFNPHHFDFRDLMLEVEDIVYANEILHAQIGQLAGRDKDAFVVQQLETALSFSSEKVSLHNFSLQTARSLIKSQKSQIDFGTEEQRNKPESWQLTADWDLSRLRVADILYWYPELGQIPFFQEPTPAISSQGKLSGTLGELSIEHFWVRNRDIRLELAGRLMNVFNPSEMGFDLDVRRLSSSRQGIAAWLPAEALPTYLELPDQSSLQGSLRGRLNNLHLRLDGETRRGPLPLVSQVATTVQLTDLTDLKKLRFDILIDSCYLTRPDLLAYFPPALLPKTVLLPESFRLKGGAAGRLASIATNLQLQTFRGQKTTTYRVNGRVDSLQSATGRGGELELDVQGLDREELSALLPTEWLPDSMRWPDLSRLSGKIQGQVDSLAADLRFLTNLGNGQLSGSLLKQENYELLFEWNAFQPALLFTEGYLDSLLGFSPVPLAIRLQAAGQGLDTSEQTWGDLQLNIWKDGTVMSSGLVLQANLLAQLLKAGLTANDKGLNLASELAFNYGTDVAQTDFVLDLQQLDFQQLKVSEIPIQLTGAMEANFEGLSADTLSGQLLARGWTLLYDSTFRSVDSLLLTARMENGDNDIRLTSDLLNARLKGFFEFSRTAQALKQQLTHYWDQAVADSLVGQTPDRFAFEMELCRPEVLTMGFLPGLQELLPAEWSIQYDNRQPQLETNLSIPHLRWADTQLDTIEFEMTAAANGFQYQLGIRNVDVQTVARVPAMQWEGQYEEDRLTAKFIALDEQEQARFDVTTHLRRSDGPVYELQLDQQQLLDYQWWQVSANNLIAFQNDLLRVQDWRLFRERESIEIREISKGRLRVLFQRFDLDLVANMLDQQQPYFGGVMNGDVAILRPLGEREMNANLTIDSLSFFDAKLGDLVLSGNMDQVAAETQVKLSGQGNDLALAGKYAWKDTDSGLDFQLDLNRVSLASLEPLSADYLRGLRGALKGKLHLAGSTQKPLLEGSIHFDSTAFDVRLLNTQLRLGNQPIIFDGNEITFQDLEIFDAANHRGVLKKGLTTTDYRRFQLNTDLQAENFEVLNTTSIDNDLYYGKLAVDATALLRGSLLEPDIEIFAKPRRDSEITYVYRAGTPQVQPWEGVVEFVTIDEEEELGLYADQQLVEISQELNLKVSVKLEMTEDLTFKLITNPLTNDYFEGKAKGNLNYNQFPSGRMELTGLLEMVEGRYLFTYQEVVRRSFAVENGSTIRWTGDPLNPDLNIRVLYDVETSPFPLIAQSVGQEGQANRKETFQVYLTITGSPSKTDIRTNIVYPDIPGNSSNAAVQNAIQTINRDPSQQNTQAFSLILFNGFIGGNTNQTDFQVSELGLESNISSLITKQLNNLANRYIKFVELDIDLENYERKGTGFKETQADFRVSLRKQFLNDRLAISLDGVASAQTDPQTAGATYCLDNLTFEYDLTPDGRFRVKVYNQRDYDDIITGNGLKIGGALVFSKDFNEIRLTKKKNE